MEYLISIKYYMKPRRFKAGFLFSFIIIFLVNDENIKNNILFIHSFYFLYS